MKSAPNHVDGGDDEERQTREPARLTWVRRCAWQRPSRRLCRVRAIGRMRSSSRSSALGGCRDNRISMPASRCRPRGCSVSRHNPGATAHVRDTRYRCKALWRIPTATNVSPIRLLRCAFAALNSSSMQGPETRVRTLILKDFSPRANVDLPSTIDATTIAEADAVVLSGEPYWALRIVQTIRSLGIARPILVVCSDDGAAADVGLLGADICMRADADATERAACVSVLRSLASRRSRAPLGESHADKVFLDRTDRTVQLNGVRYVFAPSQFSIFAYLVEREGSWVKSEQLMREALRTHHSPDSSVVRFHIHSIRKTLGPNSRCVMSDIRYRRGYMFSLSTARFAPAHR